MTAGRKSAPSWDGPPLGRRIHGGRRPPLLSTRILLGLQFTITLSASHCPAISIVRNILILAGQLTTPPASFPLHYRRIFYGTISRSNGRALRGRERQRRHIERARIPIAARLCLSALTSLRVVREAAVAGRGGSGRLPDDALAVLVDAAAARRPGAPGGDTPARHLHRRRRGTNPANPDRNAVKIDLF